MSRRQAGAPLIAFQGYKYKGCFTRTGATAKKYFYLKLEFLATGD